MAITPLAFNPPLGHKDKNTFLTDPPDEDTWRGYLQELHDQVRDYINETVNAAIEAVQTSNGLKLPASGGTMTNYAETVVTNATATGAVALNIATGNVFDVTLSGDTTFSFTNPAAAGKACSITLILRQGAVAKTVTWPASVKWSNDTAPDISTASKTSILTFVTVDGGTRWYGFLGGNKFTT